MFGEMFWKDSWVLCEILELWHFGKKEFQLKANNPLADSPYFIMKKIEDVWGMKGEVSSFTLGSKLNKFGGAKGVHTE